LNRQLNARDIFDEVFPVVQLRPFSLQVNFTGLNPNGYSEAQFLFCRGYAVAALRASP